MRCCGRCTKSRVAKATALTGVFLVLLGLVVSVVILGEIESQIADGIKIPTDRSSKAFAKWADARTEDVAAKFWNIYMYNTTNPLDVTLHGARPHVEEVGPFVFREYKVRYNVTFHDGNKRVESNNRFEYVAQPHLSVAPMDTKITNIWLPYLVFRNRLNAGIAPLLDMAAPLLGPGFAKQAEDFALFVAGEVLSFKKGIEVAARVICAPVQEPTEDCTRQAVLQWGSLAGFTNPHFGIDVAAGTSYGDNQAVRNLLSSTEEGQVLVDIIQGLRDDGQYPEFGSYVKFVQDNPSAVFSQDTILGLVLGEGTAGAFFQCPLLKSSVNVTLSVPFTGINIPIPDGLPCPIILSFLQVVQEALGGTIPVVSLLYPLSADQLHTLHLFAQDITESVLKVLGRVGGVEDDRTKMWTSRTPQQWVFKFLDPLLVMLGLVETGFNSAFFPDNSTSNAAAYLDDPATEILNTGHGDADKSSTFVQWDGHRVLPQRENAQPSSPGGIWCNAAVPVSGHSTSQQAPGYRDHLFSWRNSITKSSRPQVFVSDVRRTVDFSFYEEVKVKNIDTLRFRISDKSFAPDPVFSQEQFGLVNMTCPSGGQPVFLTLPRYLRASPAVQAMRADGMPVPDPDKHETFIDIDPITGATLRGYERLQVNVLLPSPLVNETLYMPVLYIELASELTDKQADEYKEKVVFAFKIHRGMFLSLVIVGAIFIVAGSVVAYVLRHSSPPSGTTDGMDTDYGQPLLVTSSYTPPVMSETGGTIN